MKTLSKPFQREKETLAAKGEYDSSTEAERSFMLAEFELIQDKAQAEGLDVRGRQIIRGVDSFREVAEAINSVPFNAAAFIEVGPPVDEGPVKVTRMFVVKRRDPELKDDTITTFFQLDLIRDGGKETLESSVLFNEVTDGNVAKRAEVSFDGETGHIVGHHEMTSKGVIKKLPDPDPNACNNDIRQAVETLDQPVIEVVNRETGEFEVVKARDEGISATLSVVDTQVERRSLFKSSKLALKLGKRAAKDAFKAARSQTGESN